jgi:DNA-binding response OmpR family regulator
MKKDLLVIERNTKDSLTSLLSAEGYSVYLAETAGAGLDALNKHNITHAVILNAISMRTNGARTCASLKRAAPRVSVLIYSNQEKPDKADMLVRPGLSIRKLLNSIEMFSPLDRNRCLSYGDICLDEGYFCISPQKGIVQSYATSRVGSDRDNNSCTISSISMG